MIEVAREPVDLSKWDNGDPPFYLEVFGETSPQLDMNYEEVVPPTGDSPQATGNSPIYEYWWTLGHPGLKPEHHHLLQGRTEADQVERSTNALVPLCQRCAMPRPEPKVNAASVSLLIWRGASQRLRPPAIQLPL